MFRRLETIKQDVYYLYSEVAMELCIKNNYELWGVQSIRSLPLPPCLKSIIDKWSYIGYGALE